MTYGDSRLDFSLCGSPKCLLEAKSVTKVKDDIAMFPDAVTERGARHLRSLLEAKEQGYESAILFVVQRENALRFSPHDETDANFGRLFREVVARGSDSGG